MSRYLATPVGRPLTQIFLNKGKASAVPWMGAAFFAALGLTAAVLAATGTQEKGIHVALQVTGRFSFLCFWPAYVGSAIAILFGQRFAIFARYRREFGLSFASAQLVHVALVIWLIANSSRPVTEGVMLFFAVGVVWTYVLALSSVERLQHGFSPDLPRILRSLGVEYIAFAFFADFVLYPIQSGVKHPLAYAPFSLLLIFASLMRMAAMTRSSGLGRIFRVSAWAVHVAGRRTTVKDDL